MMVVTSKPGGREMAEAERCETCKFFGRVIDADLEPSGQCCKRAPDKYAVTRVERVPLPVGPPVTHLVSHKRIESPFPAVWPSDWCGDYVKAEDGRRLLRLPLGAIAPPFEPTHAALDADGFVDPPAHAAEG